MTEGTRRSVVGGMAAGAGLAGSRRRLREVRTGPDRTQELRARAGLVGQGLMPPDLPCDAGPTAPSDRCHRKRGGRLDGTLEETIRQLRDRMKGQPQDHARGATGPPFRAFFVQGFRVSTLSRQFSIFLLVWFIADLTA
jgi:hypothetical protein